MTSDHAAKFTMKSGNAWTDRALFNRLREESSLGVSPETEPQASARLACVVRSPGSIRAVDTEMTAQQLFLCCTSCYTRRHRFSSEKNAFARSGPDTGETPFVEKHRKQAYE